MHDDTESAKFQPTHLLAVDPEEDYTLIITRPTLDYPLDGSRDVWVAHVVCVGLCAFLRRKSAEGGRFHLLHTYTSSEHQSLKP